MRKSSEYTDLGWLADDLEDPGVKNMKINGKDFADPKFKIGDLIRSKSQLNIEVWIKPDTIYEVLRTSSEYNPGNKCILPNSCAHSMHEPSLRHFVTIINNFGEQGVMSEECFDPLISSFYELEAPLEKK